MLLPDSAVPSAPHLDEGLGDIHVEDLATSLSRFDYRVPRHSHADLFQFFVIETGRSDCHLGKQYFSLDSPGVLAVPSDTAHQFAFSAETTGFIVSLSEMLLRAFERISGSGDWLAALRQASWMPLPSDHDALQNGKALWEQFTQSHDDRLQLTASALTFVSSIVAVCGDRQTDQQDDVPVAQRRLVDTFLEDIEENYASRDTVADYCERLGVTERTLRRATTACLQLSPIAMVHKRKCLEAQRLLRFTPLSISAIAHTLGFTDPSYFSRRFKQLTGKVPRDIRP